MSELPSLVRVKRKRFADPAPDLFLEDRSTKRSQTWQFRLQTPHPNSLSAVTPHQTSNSTSTHAQDAEVSTSLPPPSADSRRREYRLAIDRSRLQPNLRKRKAQLDVTDIPIFVEARSTAKKARLHADDSALGSAAQTPAQPATSFKRPSANVKERQWRAETWQRAGGSADATQTESEDAPSQELVDALSAFADEEAAREEAVQHQQKPRVASIPKRPVQRFRDRNPEEYAAQLAVTSARASNGSAQYDVDMDVDVSDEDDYVYDTYVRTREPVMLPTVGSDDHDVESARLAYLVITEQDQPFWETYFEDEESDKEFETDDEDENAEGYYGADYPEDEVASDDEFDRGAYGYRHAGSDDEQWGSDDGAWSDDGDQNPWKKYPWMKGDKKVSSDDDGDEAFA